MGAAGALIGRPLLIIALVIAGTYVPFLTNSLLALPLFALSVVVLLVAALALYKKRSRLAGSVLFLAVLGLVGSYAHHLLEAE